MGQRSHSISESVKYYQASHSISSPDPILSIWAWSSIERASQQRATRSNMDRARDQTSTSIHVVMSQNMTVSAQISKVNFTK